MTVAAAVERQTIGGRLWFYTNYHCNLACRYCLTESKPNAPRRELDRATIEQLAAEAVELGFASFGVTGGEPFLRPDMVAVATALARRLPTVVLTNGTLFTPRLLAALHPLAGLPLALQISLDSADPDVNDAARASGNFASVIAAIPALLELGLRVRIGTTIDAGDDAALARLCALHQTLGIGEADHVVRPILRRGRAERNQLGVAVALAELPAELTITAEGAFWSPAAPTVRGGELDIDYLLTRTISPLAIPATAMLRYAGARPLLEPALRVT